MLNLIINLVGMVFFAELLIGLIIDFVRYGFWGTLILYAGVFIIIAGILGNINAPGTEIWFVFIVVFIQTARFILLIMSLASGD